MNGFKALFLGLYYIFKSLVLLFVPSSCRSKSVKGEVVLITGGGQGIGQLLALRFAEKGANLVIWDINQTTLDETARLVKTHGVSCFTYIVDVTNAELVYATAAQVRAEAGPVTILVNNAGIVSGYDFMDIPEAKIRQTFEVNVISHFWICKAFLGDMMSSNRGHVVTIASLASVFGISGLTDYTASKFAALGFHESIQAELRSKGFEGIKMTVVCPNFINTGMFAGVKKARLLPILDKEYVVKRIMEAVLTEKEILMMPRMAYVFYFIKGWLPAKTFNIFAGDLLKTTKCMRNVVVKKTDANSNNSFAV